jgi:biotin synthase-like enzyme
MGFIMVGKIMLKGQIKKLIRQEDGLFEKAYKLAAQKPLVLSAPFIMTRSCQVTPLCRYCNWRAYRGVMKNYGNAKISKKEAISRSLRIKQSGVDYIHILSGWMGTVLPIYFFDYIADMKKNTGLKIIADFAAVNRQDLITLKEIGVDCVSCSLETTNIGIFRALKPGDSYEARLKTLQDAKELGLKTATNLIIGLGESIDDIDTSIRLAEELSLSLLSMTSFVPTPFTETETWGRPKPYFVATVVAAARICMPELDIAASFGCDNTSVNYAWGIKCGANTFSVALRNPQETPALVGDELSNIQTMWEDSKTINKNKVTPPTLVKRRK